MPGFDTTLDVLMASTNRGAGRLLAHLLTAGDMTLRRRTVERLVGSTDERRQALVVTHFKDLGHELETYVLEQIGRLGPGLRAAMATRRPQSQAAALDLIDQTQDVSLAYLVGEAVNTADEAVRGRAVDLLYRWAVDLRRAEREQPAAAPVGSGLALLRRRKFVLEGLQKAFGLRLAVDAPRILRAAAMLADESAGWFWGALDLRRDARRQALMSSLAARLEPEMFAFVVQALERPSTGADAAELVDREFPRHDLELLLAEFGRRPMISQEAARRLRSVQWLSPGSKILTALPAAAVSQALALAVQSGLAPTQIALLCRTVATGHPEAEARRVAVEALAHAGEAALADLRHVAGAASEQTAALAVLFLARRGKLAAPTDIEISNLLRDWHALDETERREIGRSLTLALRSQPEPLRPHLRRDAPGRSAAVNLLRLAEAPEPFTAELADLAADESDHRLQSAAVAAVAESRAAGVAEILRQSLRSADGRVRANAVEAFDRRHAEPEVFLPFVNDTNNRVRANAALALIERNSPEGRETLRAMLKAGEAERLSALWVFSRSRPKGFAATAELLSRQDPSRLVRQKAAALLASA